MRLYQYLTNMSAKTYQVCILAKSKKEAIKIAHAVSLDIKIYQRAKPINCDKENYYQVQIEKLKYYVKEKVFIIC